MWREGMSETELFVKPKIIVTGAKVKDVRLNWLLNLGMRCNVENRILIQIPGDYYGKEYDEYGITLIGVRHEGRAEFCRTDFCHEFFESKNPPVDKDPDWHIEVWLRRVQLKKYITSVEEIFENNRWVTKILGIQEDPPELQARIVRKLSRALNLGRNQYGQTLYEFRRKAREVIERAATDPTLLLKTKAGKTSDKSRNRGFSKRALARLMGMRPEVFLQYLSLCPDDEWQKYCELYDFFMAENAGKESP